MTESRYWELDLALRLVAGVFALVLAIVAWQQYSDGRERQFKEPYLEARLAYVESMFDAMSALDRAATPEEKVIALQNFWMLYSGKSRLYLDHEMFAALDYPSEYVVVCVEKREGVENESIDCANTNASGTMSMFAKAARRSISRAWELNFGEIGANDPWFPEQMEGR